MQKYWDNLVSDQLLKYLETNNIIKSNQYGFRKKHSCMLQLLKIKNIIHSNVNENKITILIYIDLKQAFPSINFDNLLDDLKNIGISNNELNWFTTYIYIYIYII